ncbi:hypothetical protein IEO21_08802 [Rhodonia placenta]|uniref:Uncharacterized protein n=1 Tax=Rhodonia placenta TaxID=104341 RepID=A0A8H7NVK8_9APHY|nr:hypothetical protein IEO21_08802 [Postia placenta]
MQNAQDNLDEPTPTESAPPHAHPIPLTANQERKLVDYLDGQLLEITRNYKKRSQPSTALPTLASYLTATHTILSLVLQIPPAGPSSYLRTSFLLRLTGEVLNSISGYTPDAEALSQLLSWLEDLDKGWLAVLNGETWDTVERIGIETSLPDEPARSTIVSQTDRTRLRSILIAGTNRLEEWLAELEAPDQNFQSALDKLGLQQDFEDLFSRTLSAMGSLDGSMNDPGGMTGTC